MGKEFTHTDEEAVDDMRLRVATERDFTRKRAPAAVVPGGTVVAHWACRGGCGRVVPVTEAGTDAMLIFNQQLRKRGEQPIDTARTVFCDACAAEGRKYAEAEQHKKRRAISDRVQQLRDGATGDVAKRLQDELIKLGCDDVRGIVAAINERKASGSTVKRGGLR